MAEFKCNRCGNEDNKYIGKNLNGNLYCRKCISFQGKEACTKEKDDGMVVLDIKYPLSKEQKDISSQVLNNYKSKSNTLIHAVCGAGKTELVYEVMSYALSNKQQVGFAVPRRDVVIELTPRIKSAFPSNSVTSVYGDHTAILEADIIVLTTHQLYRYNNYFDLLILDEIDAYPYKENEVLHSLFLRSIKGNYVLMSATPSKKLLNTFAKEPNKLIELLTRYHHHILPVPEIKIIFGKIKIIYLINKLRNFIIENKPVLVFAPTIEKSEQIYKTICLFVSGGNCVHSKCKNRSETIAKFKAKEYKYLITTAVLERGVTIKNLQVIIYDSDHQIYDASSLVQISGRVGRDKEAYGGEVIFLANKKTKDMENAIDEIKYANAHL
jgi:competence protein ComFA